MILLQISSSQGPSECELAVAKALRRLMAETAQMDIQTEIVEAKPGDKGNTYRSVLLALDGARTHELAQRWQGTLQWTCPSPYRPNHPRKNWFIGVAVYQERQESSSGEILFEACRASGPGGQHVNKTDSAVRATHLATGICVKVQTHRSQHANKRLAALLIEQKLAQSAEESDGKRRAAQRMFHHGVERGNAGLIFKGERFLQVSG